MNSPIPYGRQDVDEADIAAVVSVLRSDFLTQGPAVPAFEAAVAAYCGADHAVAVNSATSALHIACLALGVGPGDLVWTVPTTYVATANAALHCGATVDFVDIDSRTYNLSVVSLQEKLERAEKEGLLPKVVIPVHLCGQPCAMAEIHALAHRYGFRIIEDASHAIGSRYRGEPVGNCRYSDIVVFSFHPVKIVTTGEGGMAMTQDEALAKRMRLLRSHGVTNAPVDMAPRPADEIWNYQQVDLGFNYRMTDVAAALGLRQMERIDGFLARRRAIARQYDESLAGMPLVRPWQHEEGLSAYHLYPVRLRLQEIATTQREVHEKLRASGILVNLHYIPVYRQPFYEKLGFRAGYCPEAERYHRETLSLPMYSALTDAQQAQVVEGLARALDTRRSGSTA